MNDDGPLSAVIATYLQALDAGAQPDRAELLARYPELADDLRRFFAGQDQLLALAQPLRPGPVRGRRFGDYEILEEIGRGGMGVVYRARQVSLGRIVALKMLADDLAGEQDERLQQESRLLAELAHPNIVPVYDVGRHEGRGYFVMKEIEGSNLEQRLPGLRGDLREAARILAVVARAVDFAHGKGVLHRDLKPANVLLDEKGAPYVTDFGLARRLDSAAVLTQTGALVGTPGYMAPEQATGQRALTPAVDVWALGVMLYRLLAGELPYRGDTPLETLHRIVAGRLRPPGQLAPGVDRALEAICLRCLKSDPRDRYQTARELAEDLERWLQGQRVSARGLKWRVGSRARRLTHLGVRFWWLLVLPPLLAAGGYGLKVVGDAVWEREQEASHKAMMDRVELALERGQVELAGELFEARREWPVAERDDPVRERRERARRLLESHLFSLHEDTTAYNVYWQFNGHLMEMRPGGYRERDGWAGTVRKTFSSREEWEQAQPGGAPTGPWSGRLSDWLLERINNVGPDWVSPDGSLVLSSINPRIENAHDIFALMLRNENQSDLLPDVAALRKSLPSQYFWGPRAWGLIVGVNWFGGYDPGNVFHVYLLGKKTKKDKVLDPVRAFLLPATIHPVSWSEDGRQITFSDGLRPAYPRRTGYALRFTYDLHDRCWIRIVDDRPGTWRPPSTPDKGRISFPPDRSLCKDLGELEALAFFRAGMDEDRCKVGLSADGTRAWLEWRARQDGTPQPLINVWRMPGAPR